MKNLELIVIAENMRSTHNVGALFRLCDGLGVKQIILTGYTPLPSYDKDDRLPHLAAKIHKAINKTALGAEATLKWRHFRGASDAINYVKDKGYRVYALEQAKDSTALESVGQLDGNKIALVLGNEVSGVEDDTLRLCDRVIEIKMLGHKESHNVITATAICLYHLRLAATGIIHKHDL